MNKPTLLISALVLAAGFLISGVSYAESHSTESEMECVTQAALDEMTEDEKAELEAPLCEGDEGDESEEKAEEEPKTD